MAVNGNNSLNETIRALTCEHGLFLPPWEPQEGVTDVQIAFRGIVYILSMAYLFVGIAYLSDKFMAAIEMITSKRQEVEVDGKIVVVRVWNETVANLTLMSLGCSAPEILLSGIEIVEKHFEAGELGPGAIVGSAAFNLLFVIGVCCWIIPKGQVRRIKRLNVFLVTSTWAIVAYLWLYVILSVSTPGVIELWEALVTLACFPMTVLTAYSADRYDQWTKTYRMGRRGIILETLSDSSNELPFQFNNLPHHQSAGSEEAKEFEDHRREFLLRLQELRRKYPEMEAQQLELLATKEMIDRGTKSRAFLRVTASKKLTGLSSTSIRQSIERSDLLSYLGIAPSNQDKDDKITNVYFSPGHYTISETVEELRVNVIRENGDLSQTLLVDYATEDAGAKRGVDYVETKGTICFQPGQTRQEIVVNIIDDNIYEGDLYFYIRLFNLRSAITSSTTDEAPHRLACPSVATVMLLDDDHPGVFSLTDHSVSIHETAGVHNIHVLRKGFRGRVAVPYQTEEGTAKAGRDYEHQEGVLIFEEGETEKTVSVPIVANAFHGKDIIFYFNIEEPKLIGKDDIDSAYSGSVSGSPELYIPTNPDRTGTNERRIATEGRPRLGDVTQTLVRILENTAFKNSVDKLMKKSKLGLERGTSAWKEQFIDAFSIERDEGTGDQSKTTWKAYAMHFITFFWRLVCAFIPPESFGRGYPCFVIAIFFIGVVTGLVGDVASHLGCTVGLKDSVTAVAFVSLGTSCPELFSSKISAIQNKYADASISNVTGANAINVYLGIGLAWSMAAVYHAINGTKLVVSSSSLGFSVTIYSVMAFVCVVVLLIRRSPRISGGELGGPLKYKLPTSILFISMWATFVLVSSFEAYGYIQGF